MIARQRGIRILNNAPRVNMRLKVKGIARYAQLVTTVEELIKTRLSAPLALMRMKALLLAQCVPWGIAALTKKENT